MTDDPFSDPNIYMSFTMKEPNDKSEFKCSAEGKDTCTLSGAQLQHGLGSDKLVYIGVYCQNQCRFQIHPTMQKIVELQDNMELQLDFKPDESKIFKVKVPSQSELGGLEKDRITSLTILAAPLIQSATQNQADLILSATTDQRKSPGTNDIQGVPVWTSGKAIHLTEDSEDNQLCTDCWVKILLSVTKEGRYTIISKANTGDAQRAFEDKVIYGVSQPGEKTCYKYHIQDSQKDLDVRFKLYSGSSSQTIDPLDMPESWNSSVFKFSGAFDSEYIITPRMRKEVGHEDGLYYICNFAHTLNSFSAIVREVDRDQDFTQIENGFFYSEEIETSKQAFIYKVPRLEFSNEDIKINFYLEVFDGPLPKMAVRYCSKYQDLESDVAMNKCGKEIAHQSTEDIIQRSQSSTDQQKFVWAQAESGINILQMSVDHDESKCDSKLDGKQQPTKCFYQVVVLGEEGQLTKYQLSASRYQNNYEIIRGSLPKVASVEMNDIKFFKYTLTEKNSYKTVSFQLKTFHGDADLFVSRTDPWPRGADQSDKASTGEGTDRVDFTKKPLGGDYYIGIVGYQDSTFEIKVVLQGQKESEWKLMEGNQLDRKYQLLVDGYPKMGELHNEEDSDKYRIEVDMEEGFEKPIKIDVVNLNDEFNVKVFISFKREPSPINLDDNALQYFSEGDKHIEIPVGSKHYHSKGTYYILIMPQNDLVNTIYRYFFEDDYYKYQIKYSLKGTFEFLSLGVLTESMIGASTKHYYRYIVEDRKIDQKLSLNMYEGTSVIKQEFDMDLAKKVDSKNHDGNIIYEGQSTTLIVGRDELSKKCADEITPCVLYFGIKCVSTGHKTCTYSLKITDPNAGPEKLTVGTPIQDNVENDEINQYYIAVTEEHVKDDQQINIVLNTLQGDADLYIKIQENQNLITRKDWVLPTSTEYDVKSDLAVKQDLANIPSKLLQSCIKKAKLSDVYKRLSAENEQAQCAILIAVKGKQGTDISQYSLVSYVNLQQLQSGRAAYGQVEDRGYQYFTYQVTCQKCEVIIGVQDFSGGDPDLYINYGQDSLPDKEKFTFKSTSFSSEVFILNLSDEYFKRHKIPSMNGTYTIGVYGKRSSSFEITATQNDNRIITLQDSMRNSQNAYQIVFYQWYNKQGENQRDDIQVEVDVNHGQVDVYISTYDHDVENQNIVDRLPESARKSIYSLNNLKTTSNSVEGQLLIQAADVNYCANCWYLIGVHTKDLQSDYEIKINSLQADFKNSRFIKMGSPERLTVSKSGKEIFKFIIDEKQDVQITTSVHHSGNGQILTVINSDPDSENSIKSYEGGGSVMLDVMHQEVQTGVLYYIIVSNPDELVDADFTIQINQDNSVIEIQNGVPLTVTFQDDQDISKNFAMSLPEGSSILTLQLQPLYTENQSKFQPFLYYQIVDSLGEVKDTVDFPPSGDGFGIKRSYEGNGFLTLSKKIEIQGQDPGVLLSVYMASNRRRNGDKSAHDVIVYASTQKEKILSSNVQLLESMFSNEQVEYIRLDESITKQSSGYTIIEKSTCLGQTKDQYLIDPSDIKSVVKGTYFNDKAGGKQIISFKNPVPDFYVVVESVELTNKTTSAFRDGLGNRAQFMINTYQSKEKITKSPKHRMMPLSAEITYTKSETSPKIVNIAWEPLVTDANVTYTVVLSEDPQANLQSACVQNQDVYMSNNYKRYMTSETNYTIGVKPGKENVINVVATITGGEDMDEITLYNQILVTVTNEEVARAQSSKGSIMYVLIFLMAAGGAGYVIIYKRDQYCNFMTRQKEPQLQHHELGQFSMRSDVDYNPPQAYNMDDSISEQ